MPHGQLLVNDAIKSSALPEIRGDD
uniref:Uncharacterized protein n=1 Tax=Rhizophora mucronata TaxID=61149 RepID=A0A2P2QK52_RHIMU